MTMKFTIEKMAEIDTVRDCDKNNVDKNVSAKICRQKKF